MPAVASCAQLWQAARRSCSLVGLRFCREGRQGSSQRRALRVGVDVQQDVVVQLSARCLCRKLWRRGCKWFWNTGIRVCTKRNSEFSSCSLIHPGIPGHCLRQRRESKDQRRLLGQSCGYKGLSPAEQLTLLLLHTATAPTSS